jgi:hypothetical protein
MPRMKRTGPGPMTREQFMHHVEVLITKVLGLMPPFPRSMAYLEFESARVATGHDRAVEIGELFGRTRMVADTSVGKKIHEDLYTSNVFFVIGQLMKMPKYATVSLEEHAFVARRTLAAMNYLNRIHRKLLLSRG